MEQQQPNFLMSLLYTDQQSNSLYTNTTLNKQGRTKKIFAEMLSLKMVNYNELSDEQQYPT